MKKVLVVTDFSEVADHAIAYACNMANKLLITHFFILNTYENIPIYDSGEAGSLALSLQEADAVEESRIEELKLLKSRLEQELKPDIKITPIIINDALPNAVNQLCDEEAIDLVVMGFRPKDELEEWIIGSNVQKAVDKIRFPVLLIPKSAAISIPQHIILASNFKEPLTRPIQLKLHQFLQKFNGKVTAVHQCHKGGLDAQESKLANDLQIELQHYNCQLTLLQDVQDLPTLLNNYARRNNASLIISIHKMRGFLANLFHKSITKNLAWQSEVPLLVLHM